MSSLKMRHVAFGLAAAGVLTAGLLAGVGYKLHGSPSLEAAEPAGPEASAPADRDQDPRHADAPAATVNIDKERGKVTVKAPHTDVDVDPEHGRVKVRAPYVNLDIRW